MFVVGVVGGLILYDQGDNDSVPGWLLAVDFYTGMALCLLLWFRRRWPIQLAVVAAIVTTYSEAGSAACLLITMTVAIYFRLRVTLHRSNGVRLTVEVPNTSDTNQYVQSLTLNGKPRAESWLPESFITQGGRITATLGATPTDWGTPHLDH